MLINKYRNKFKIDSINEVQIDKMILSEIQAELKNGALTGDKLIALEKKLAKQIEDMRNGIVEKKEIADNKREKPQHGVKAKRWICILMFLVMVGTIVFAIIYMQKIRKACGEYKYFLSGHGGCTHDQCSSLQILVKGGRC